MGFDDEPISPVSRELTVTKRKPKATMSTAPSKFILSAGASEMAMTSPSEPRRTYLRGMSFSVRSTELTLSPVDFKPFIPATAPWMIVGRLWNKLIIPPAATAPAPI